MNGKKFILKQYNMQDDIYNPAPRFDESNQIHETAIIYDCVELGKNNIIGPYTVIGSNGEIRGCKEFNGKVIIGDGNVISEHVTIQRPAPAEQSTVIGNNNIIMAHAHIGHDVQIGDNCEICTGVILGGYAKIKNKVKLKLGVTVRNRKVIEEEALVGLGAAVVKDVEAKSVVVGNPAKPLVRK
jgi:UDP-N-acetylglucosamine acyltransferase